jgi:hypothetical protein
LKGVSIKQESATLFKWEEVTPEKVTGVYNHCLKLKRFQGTNVGCVIMMVIIFIGFIFVGPIIGVLSTVLTAMFPLFAAIVDTLILFVGLVVTGNRSAWIPAGLMQKTEIVKRLLERPALKNDPALSMVPLLEIGTSKKGSFPRDARIMMRFKDAPNDFIGIQAQVSINTVKSTAYPYFYVVVIAKPGFKLLEKVTDPGLKNITVETEETGEVDVVIIRQTTTKTSGYHTNTIVQDFILENSIKIVKSLIRVKQE